MARETWENMRDRAIVELRNREEASFEGRVEGWMRRAYDEIAAIYKFFCFNEIEALSLPSGQNSISIAAVSPSLRFIRSLRNDTTRRRINPGDDLQIDNLDVLSLGEPRKYDHYASALIFDTTADQTYSLSLRYTKVITEPVFTGAAVPETPQEWDDVIYHRTLWKGFGGLYEAERAEYNRTLMLALIAELPEGRSTETDDSYTGIKVRMK